MKKINQHFRLFMVTAVLLIFTFNFSKVLATYGNNTLAADNQLSENNIQSFTLESTSKIESEFCKNRSSQEKILPEENNKKTMLPHMDHNPRHGGQFFMAANKHYHLEGVYSMECGFELYLYDEFTRPINPDVFQAFIKVNQIFSDEQRWESHLFLTATPDQQKLTSYKLQLESDDNGDTGKVSIDLYLKYPGNQEPDIYNFLNYLIEKRPSSNSKKALFGLLPQILKI
ncbi:MAG: hypothetical protein RPU64_00080 [Candidatus Sedimenticola sp. (ex Thyasira tokunagai)]